MTTLEQAIALADRRAAGRHARYTVWHVARDRWGRDAVFYVRRHDPTRHPEPPLDLAPEKPDLVYVTPALAPLTGIRLESGHCYRNGWGHMSLVMGPTGHDGIVWTLAGFHYRQSDGRHAPFSTPNPTPSPDDMAEEVPVPEYWDGVYPRKETPR